MPDTGNHLYVMSSDDAHVRFWADGLGLAAKRYTVIFANDYAMQKGARALFERIENEIILTTPSVLLVDISTPLFDPYLLSDLRSRHRLLVVLLALDDEFKFDWFSASYATLADLVLTTDAVAVNRYRAAGIDAHLFVAPMFIPPRPQESRESRHGVTFVGCVDASKPSRFTLAQFLEENHIPVSYFASTGSRDPAFLSREEMCSIFRDSAINLNFSGINTYAGRFNNVLCERIRGMKFRPLEILAAGGFCLSEYSISLASHLDDGVDIAFFRSKADLLNKIRHFLHNPEEARRIAETGARKVASRFSQEAVAARFAELVTEAHASYGLDLYGEPQRPTVSHWLASSFLLTTLTNSVSLLFAMEIRIFLADLMCICIFLRRIAATNGGWEAIRLSLFAIYRLAREVIENVRQARPPMRDTNNEREFVYQGK